MAGVRRMKDRYSLLVDLIVGRIEVYPANSLLTSPVGEEPGRGQVLVAPGLVMAFTGQTGPPRHPLTQTQARVRSRIPAQYAGYPGIEYRHGLQLAVDNISQTNSSRA